MLHHLSERLSYANVVATLALFVALGGTGYAAVQLSRGEVKAKHIARGAVTSSKVRDRTLRSRDFRRGLIPARPGFLQRVVSPGSRLATSQAPQPIPGATLDLPKGRADEAWAIWGSVQFDGAAADVTCDLSDSNLPVTSVYSLDMTLPQGRSALSLIGRSARADRARTVLLRCAIRPGYPGAGALVDVVRASLHAQRGRYLGPEPNTG